MLTQLHGFGRFEKVVHVEKSFPPTYNTVDFKSHAKPVLSMSKGREAAKSPKAGNEQDLDRIYKINEIVFGNRIREIFSFRPKSGPSPDPVLGRLCESCLVWILSWRLRPQPRNHFFCFPNSR